MNFVFQGGKWVAITKQMLEHDTELQKMIVSHSATSIKQPYKNEKELQTLIEDYPDLLAGDQINKDAPRRWLLVKREMGIGKWSVDHLFLDQDGVPTLVEVKLHTNALSRRELIGQMLDYAANGAAYWTDTTLRASFAKTCQQRGDKANQKLADLLNIDASEAGAEINPAVEDFWQKVKMNLEAEELRLLFVADGFRPETLRVIEFLDRSLNRSTPKIQALAIKVEQSFSSNGVEPQIKSLVSNVIRDTEKMAPQKNASAVRGEGRQWEEVTYFDDMEARGNTEATKVARSILKWIQDKMLRDVTLSVGWVGGEYGSYNPFLTLNNVVIRMFAVKSTGSIEFYSKWLSNKPPFKDISKRDELFTRLSALTGKSIEELKTGTYDSAKLSEFGEKANLTQLLSSLDWIVEELQRANS